MSFQKSDGMSYAPQGVPKPVVGVGEFPFAVAHLDHGHIFGQTNGLLEAGGELKWVYDPDPAKVDAFIATVGARVREVRQRKGMARRVLSELSGVVLP